ncbi:hypothetical protein RRG08_058893 [Elysia crispata]|uniref:Uncharacterized protein n=1 Tax=Elysia crispata TaxID=231223 RepID=A0AAE0XZM7_9GAST|nr:hypothetical protein RRG08_058893 [Elysia crispata]
MDTELKETERQTDRYRDILVLTELRETERQTDRYRDILADTALRETRDTLKDTEISWRTQRSGRQETH